MNENSLNQDIVSGKTHFNIIFYCFKHHKQGGGISKRYMLAIFFFPAFAGALLHFLAFTPVVWMKNKRKGNLLIKKTLLHSATSGLKLHTSEKSDLTLSEPKQTKTHLTNSGKAAACTGWEIILQLPDKPQPEALCFRLRGRNVALSYAFQKVNLSSVPPCS